jgi:hypothetical protein
MKQKNDDCCFFFYLFFFSLSFHEIEKCNQRGHIQGDFESCADILTSGRTTQRVTIEQIMPYTNIEIFREKGAKSFSKKV